MAEAQGTPPETLKGGVIAYLTVDGAIKAGEFYKKALAAEHVHLYKPDDKGRTMHLHLHINAGSVMLADPFPDHDMPYVPAAGFTLTLPVEDVDFWWQRAVDGGCTGTVAPADMFWGDRYAALKDPFGISWAFVGPKKG